ncbi:MAG: hypothetical protein ABI672_02275 [Vicinamibacteria bacterium]
MKPGFWKLIRQPSAFLPLVMSLLALAVVLGHVAMFGAVREADEGTPAHIFHLLILAQAPMIVVFAARWLPKAPEHSLLILVLQAGGVVAAFAPVFWFNL